MASFAQLNTDRVLAIGRNAVYFEDYVLSIQYFNQIIKVKPYLVEPYFYRAIAKIKLEDYVGAERDCNEVIERNPFMPQAFYARGFVRLRLGNAEQAESDFSKALEFSPDNETYTIMRIETYLVGKKYDEALKDVEQLMRRNNKSTDLLYERGRILLMRGDTLDALSNFDNLVVVDKTNPDAWAARALVKLQMNDNRGALADYDKTIQLGTRNAGYYINRGILNYQVKNYRGALSDYDKAVELDPTNQAALFNRSLLRAEVGDVNNAITDLNTVITRDPDYPNAIYQRALLHAELTDWTAAVDDYTAIIKKYPNFVPALFGRATAYERLGKKRAAFEDYDHAQTLMERAKNKKDPTVQKSLVVKPAVAQEESMVKERSRLFSVKSTGENTAATSVRGSIQNQYTDIVNEKNFVLSYYQKEDLVRQGDKYSQLVSVFNAKKVSLASLKLINREQPLTNQLIAFHFRSIDEYSQRIQAHETNPDLYFARGIDYALVQDFGSAIADFSRVINLDATYALAYFCRANMRFKELEFRVNNQTSDPLNSDQSGLSDNQHTPDFDVIMRDYDKTLELAPDFAMAWFNKANVLCVQKEFRLAILNYSNAIAIDHDFAEAYFNRGLTYIYLGDIKNGTADLSKAGELGIYQAYNYLKRMRD